jgi:hypothetical protein
MENMIYIYVYDISELSSCHVECNVRRSSDQSIKPSLLDGDKDSWEAVPTKSPLGQSPLPKTQKITKEVEDIG